MLTFEAWLRGCKFELDEADVVVNFSQCFSVEAHIYYAQGPITKALNDMFSELNPIHKLIYELCKPYLAIYDKGLNLRFRRRSKLFIATSKFCASMYEGWGIKADGIIYPPLDCELFKPVTSKPSGDYALTYFGKETKYSTLKILADVGIRIKAFGSKAQNMPKALLRHPNVEFLGRVSDEDLVNLYSNALYTLFTFNHEPFGYVPVESMACGTPVLTYNRQGPSESVMDGVTGWLTNNDEELIRLAVKIWRDGYPQWMRSRCRERALEFDVKAIAEKWHRLIKRIL